MGEKECFPSERYAECLRSSVRRSVAFNEALRRTAHAEKRRKERRNRNSAQTLENVSRSISFPFKAFNVIRVKTKLNMCFLIHLSIIKSIYRVD